MGPISALPAFSTQQGHERIEFSNHYMFDRVMTDESICKGVIEAVLGIQVGHIEYMNAEQVREPDPHSRGIRMDVYAKCDGAIYDIEMQVRREPTLGRRFRYYQAAIDWGLLGKNEEYDRLPESYVVFLCMGDPFDEGLPVYTFERECLEAKDCSLGCGSHWVALNAAAWEQERNPTLRSLLQYMKNGQVGDDELVREIDAAVTRVNEDSRWVSKVWCVSTIEENEARRNRILNRQARTEGREEGRVEGRAEGLAEGREEGRVETEQRSSALIKRLLAEGRLDDLAKAGDDPANLQRLMDELGLS